jgi:hypothetical protein
MYSLLMSGFGRSCSFLILSRNSFSSGCSGSERRGDEGLGDDWSFS